MRRSCAKTASLYSPGVPMLCDNDPFLRSRCLPCWHLNSFSLPPPLSLQVVPSAWLGITLALKCHVSHRAHDLGIHSQLCCQISSPLTKYSPKQDYFQLSYNPSRLTGSSESSPWCVESKSYLEHETLALLLPFHSMPLSTSDRVTFQIGKGKGELKIIPSIFLNMNQTKASFF